MVAPLVWKVIGYVGAGLVILALAIGLGVKLTQKTEGYKSNRDQSFYTVQPRFGCATVHIHGGQDVAKGTNSSVPGAGK